MKRHILIQGRVQGVGFRYFVLREAQKCGACGWVRNLYGGTVEVVAEADPLVMQSFIEALRRGPGWSRVEQIEINAIDGIENLLEDFSIYPSAERPITGKELERR